LDGSPRKALNYDNACVFADGFVALGRKGFGSPAHRKKDLALAIGRDSERDSANGPDQFLIQLFGHSRPPFPSIHQLSSG
jgi:hypothetical protein